MKFFTKIYLLFLLVILFSSLASVFMLFEFIEQSSQQEASENMKEGSDIISMNFQSFKRSMWRYLAKIQNDEELIGLLESVGWTHDDVAGVLLSYPQPLEVDFIILSGEGYSVFPISSINDPYDDLYSLKLERWHPNVSIADFSTGLSLMGSIRLETEKGGLDVFLIKDINRSFCERLSFNTTADLFIIHNSRIIEGTLNQDHIPLEVPPPEPEWTYKEYFGIIRNSKEYNAVLRKEDLVSGDRSDLMILSMFSNYPYTRRVERFSSSIIVVILLSSALAAVTSLIFSRTITRPVKALSSAMEKIKQSDFSVSLPPFAGREITRLVDGFNTMASDLRKDQIARNKYIKEIKFLSDYNEEIIESIGAGICIIDSGGVIERTNGEFRKLFIKDFNRTGGVRLSELESRIINKRVKEAAGKISSGELSSYSSERIMFDDRYYQIQMYPLGGERCILTMEDVTYRAMLEDRLYQNEKLSSLTVLSAGVAHEINNPLSSIMTNVQNLMYDEKDADRLESLKWVDQETKRIARIVNDLLNFSSSSNQGAGETSINRVVEQLVKFSGYSSGRKKIVFKSILPENELFTSISSDELKQVVFNILHNAEQSITGKGEIAIGLEKDGDYAVLTVGDTGCGMDSDTLARIYDPFFTTRKGFGGTGLGLSVVYGIMRKYRGEINFESAIGRGTTVFLRLPLHV